VDGIGKETPLLIATLDGSTDILKCLVLAGADANVTDSVSFFFTLLLHGCSRPHLTGHTLVHIHLAGHC
jgi:hypothetical protein